MITWFFSSKYLCRSLILFCAKLGELRTLLSFTRSSTHKYAVRYFPSATYFPSAHSAFTHFKRMLCMLCMMLVVCTTHHQMVHAKGEAKVSSKAVQKPIKRLLKAIRYQKNELALANFDGNKQGLLLFGQEWDKQSNQDQKTFVKSLHTFFTLIAFPKLRKDLQHLETITYTQAKKQGTDVLQSASIVVLHQLKKQEIKVDFVLSQNKKKKWLISDFTIGGGVSFLTRLKKDQIQPLMEKEGFQGLLQAMQKRIEAIKKRN